MNLRDYQERAVVEAVEAIRIGRRPVLVAPTGSGKTVIGAEAVDRFGRPTVWLAHRRELISQAADGLARLGLNVGTVIAGAPVRRRRVQVASVQTLINREGVDADLIVIDEAHHAKAATYQKILDRYPGRPVLGLTATPFRLDGKPLGDIFDRIIVAARPGELCDRGTLIAPIVYAPPSADMRDVRIVAGEFNLRQAGERMDRPALVADIVATWKRYGRGRRTVAFATNVNHSRHIVEEFQRAGIAAEHLDGAVPVVERAKILARLRSGETTVVSNCMVLTEGWDLPALEVAIIARPTASLNLHLQMVGRIMRSADEKSGALVLDHAGNHLRHGEVTQEIEYSLDRAPRPERTVEGEPRLKICRVCYMVAPAGASTCPGCGAVFQTRTAVPETVDGELMRFGASVPFEDRARVWAIYRAQAERNGFKPGWAFYRYRERFGEAPTTDADGNLIDTKRATRDQKRAVYSRLLDLARSRGYREGWAAHRYRQTFGVWPRGMK